MFKRLFATLLIVAALAACSPGTGGSAAPTVAPSVDALPSESVEASPSAS
jgi:hypothetical protein